MRIPLAVFLAPLPLVIACSDQGPIQPTGNPPIAISPAAVSVETGADPITLQAVLNGTLAGNVIWTASGTGGKLTPNGLTAKFAPTDLGTDGGVVQVAATANVDGNAHTSGATITVNPSTHGRLALSIDPGGVTSGAPVDVTNADGGSKLTFVAAVATVLRSGIIDAGTYVVTADAGIFVPGTLVDGTWDGIVSFDGGTPGRSVQVPVAPNAETAVAVQYTLHGGLGRLWVPASGAIAGFTENELQVDHATSTGVTAAGARAAAFDSDGNLWATFPDGVRMWTAASLPTVNPSPARTVAISGGATGIAIRGDTVAVGLCNNGNSGGVSTFSRTDANPTLAPFNTTVGCVWGISYDVANSGKLWIVSKSGSKVYRYNSNGTIDLNGVSVTDAYGIAVDFSGNAWVSSCSGNSIQEIGPGGTPIGSALALPDFACPGGMAWDKRGGLWVLSQGNTQNPSGNLLVVNGGTGTVQLPALSSATFGGIAFAPAAVGLPVRQ